MILQTLLSFRDILLPKHNNGTDHVSFLIHESGKALPYNNIVTESYSNVKYKTKIRREARKY